jgi:hypothetical protein
MLRQWLARLMVLSGVFFFLAPVLPGSAGGIECSSGQGTYIVSNPTGSATTVAFSAFSYTQTGRAITLHLHGHYRLMLAFATLPEQGWIARFQHLQGNAYHYQSLYPFESVTFCVSPDTTHGPPVVTTVESNSTSVNANNGNRENAVGPPMYIPPQTMPHPGLSVPWSGIWHVIWMIVIVLRVILICVSTLLWLIQVCRRRGNIFPRV